MKVGTAPRAALVQRCKPAYGLCKGANVMISKDCKTAEYRPSGVLNDQLRISAKLDYQTPFSILAFLRSSSRQNPEYVR